MRHPEGMGSSKWKLRGSYYGEGVPGPEELATPEGRARMQTVVSELLASAEANGANGGFLDRLRDDWRS